MVENKKEGFDSVVLSRLLKRVNLGGLIEECVFTVKKGEAFVQAIDISNAVFLSCKENIALEDMEIGISKLSTIQRFLELGGEFIFTIKEEKLSLRQRVGGELKTMLLEVGQVPTAVTEKGSEKEIMKHATTVLDLTKAAVEQILYYTGLVDTPSISFVVNSRGAVAVNSSGGMEQEFNFGIGRVQKSAELSAEVYTKYLLSILRTITWGEGDVIPKIHLGDKSPIVITLGEQCLWALTPIIGG